jgi:hypothetical protein
MWLEIRDPLPTGDKELLFPQKSSCIARHLNGMKTFIGPCKRAPKAICSNKDMSKEEMVEAIQAEHASGHRIPPNVDNRMAARIGRPEITPRKIEVLKLIVKR